MAVFGTKSAKYPDLPPYEHPPPWIPQQQRLGNRDYDNDLRKFMTRRLILRRNHITDTILLGKTQGIDIQWFGSGRAEVVAFDGSCCDGRDWQRQKKKGEICELKALGFNVRGGEDRRCGIYISWVKPGTEAEAQGLIEGDQIVEVNGVNFETLDHTEAVTILKGNLEVSMTVRFFPYGYRKTYDQVASNVPSSNVAG